MKVAFATSGTSVDSPLDSRFGRAPGFLVYNPERNSTEFLDNAQGQHAAQGAGIHAAEMLGRAGVTHLVATHCGPKAFRVLSEAGITVLLSEAVTVAGALVEFETGKLTSLMSPDVAGHWK